MPLALEALHSARDVRPWLVYVNVKERLRMAGDLVGHPVKGNIANRVFIEADPDTGENGLVIAYTVRGDVLTIRAIKVLVV